MEKLPRQTRRADFVGIWWTLLGPGGVLVTVFSAILHFFEPVSQYGWAAVVLAATAVACGIVLVASAGMIGWRYFNPIAKLPPPTLTYDPEEVKPITEKDVTNLIDAHMIAVRRGMQDASENNRTEYAKLAGDVSGVIDKLGNADMDIRALEEQIADLRRDWDAWTRQHTDSQDRRFDWVDAGFKAILNRELMSEQAEAIERAAAKLLRIRDGEPVKNWGEWQTERTKWLSAISTWLELAEKYRVGCRSRIMTVDPDALLGDWPEPDGAFPSTDAMMAYRKVRVTLEQFRAERTEADKAVTIAAFGSPSKKGPLGG